MDLGDSSTEGEQAAVVDDVVNSLLVEASFALDCKLIRPV